jgi:sporulation protein YlmC with PRC-barrel domain
MTNSLAKSADLHGKHLLGPKNVKLGTVRETYLDLASGSVAFLVVEPPSLLGGSGKYQPVPWSAVRYDGVVAAFVCELDKAQFRAAPSYDRDQLANPVYGWPDQVTSYFSAPAA